MAAMSKKISRIFLYKTLCQGQYAVSFKDILLLFLLAGTLRQFSWTVLVDILYTQLKKTLKTLNNIFIELKTSKDCEDCSCSRSS